MEVIKPFVKWAGGKGSLISQLTNFYPFELENGTIKIENASEIDWQLYNDKYVELNQIGDTRVIKERE